MFGNYRHINITFIRDASYNFAHLLVYIIGENNCGIIHFRDYCNTNIVYVISRKYYLVYAIQVKYNIPMLLSEMVCHKFRSRLRFAIKSSVNLRKVLSIYIQKGILSGDINNSHAVKGNLNLYILTSHRNFCIKVKLEIYEFPRR